MNIPIFSFACLFFLFSALAGAAKDVKDLKDLNDVMALSQTDLTDDFDVRDPDETKPLEKIAMDQMAQLNRVFGLDVKLSISNGRGTFSLPDSGIILDEKQLEDINQKAGVVKFREVLGWILAHEMGHMRQYQEYGNDFITGTDADRRIYECQADILASQYFTTNIVDPKGDVSVPTSEVLQVAYNTGFETYSIGSHPTRSERRLAAQFGMSAGMIDRLKKMKEEDPDYASMAAQIQIQASIDMLQDKIDFKTTESLLDWSFRQSKRIVHTQPDVLQNLKLTHHEVTMDAGSGICRYYLIYQNTGTSTMHVEMEIGTYLVNPVEPTDLKARLKADAKNVTFTLDPGETQIFPGKLTTIIPGLKNADDYQPALVYYPSPDSIICCEEVASVMDPGDFTSPPEPPPAAPPVAP
jgi:hypothetical protein